MSTQQPKSCNYATLRTSGGKCGYKEGYKYWYKEQYHTKEQFGAFSLRAAVRPPYGKCWGGKPDCKQPEIPGLT